MPRINRLSISYFLFLSILGCVDPFEVPPSSSNARILVVEGRISNESTRIRVTRSSNLDSLVIAPERFATIYVENNTGIVVASLVETEPGNYFVAQSLTIGEEYRIRIETTNGDVYVSEYSNMLETPAISSLELELDTTSTRLDIFLDTEDPQKQTRYYLWQYQETYQYRPAFESLLKYENGGLREREESEQINDCWKTEESTNILLGTSIALDEDVIADQLIVSNIISRNQKFRIGYSVNISQFALSSEEFEFWTLLEKNSETLGTLFDPQPSQLPTNLQCITDPDKRVVGFVGASSVAEERVFLTRSMFRTIPFFRYENCEADTLFGRDQMRLERFRSGAFTPLNYAVDETTFDTVGIRFSNSFCGDCLQQGGTNVKPAFWF